MDLRPVNNVLVLGGGSAGFMAALALKVKLPSLRVTVIRSPPNSTSNSSPECST